MDFVLKELCYVTINYLLIFTIKNVVSASPKPHIVVILADDVGWNDVSFHGSRQISTPNIDILASEGIVLNNYYVQPMCTPTRAALLTGRYPIHNGMQHCVIRETEPRGLPTSEKLLPQYLKELGYATHIVGKWHLGFCKYEYLPTYRGFDSHYGFWTGALDYYNQLRESGGMWGRNFYRDLDQVNSTNQYSTFLYQHEAINIINRHDTSQPMFLYLAHQAGHTGNVGGKLLQAPQVYIDKFAHISDYKRRVYAAMVAVMDETVGAVRSALEARNMSHNTIIVFSSDNGGGTHTIYDNTGNNWPLRGTKGMYWEGGIRAAGIIHSPLLPHSGSVTDNMMHVTDWLPTLLTAAQGNLNATANLNGFNMWNMLKDKSGPVRSEILHNIDPLYKGDAAIRRGDFKLVMGGENLKLSDWYPPWHNKEEKKIMERYNYTVKCGIKLTNTSTECQPQLSPCLFHISSDPCEYHNIAAQYPRIVDRLQHRIKEFRKNMAKPGNLPSDPSANPVYHNGWWVPWLSAP